MPDECPPQIKKAGVRANWHLFDAETRAELLASALVVTDERATSGGRGNGRTNGATASHVPQSQYVVGMPPPRGDPYDAEEYNADGEGDGARQLQRAQRARPPSRSASGGSGDGRNGADRRRRLSPGGTFAPVSGSGSQRARDERDTTPIDPALLQADRSETAMAAKNRQLEARLAALEAHLPGAPVPLAPRRDARGVTARGRGGTRVCRRPRVPSPVSSDDNETPEAGEDHIDEVYAPDPDAVKDDSDPLKILEYKHKDLSPMQKKAILKCQSAVTASFRDVTGVPTTKVPWPKWTGEGDWTGPGMEINLEGKVTHRVNRALFRRVAEVAMQDLKKDKSTHQQWMNAPDVKLTLGLLVEIAKRTFRGFKRTYRAQHDTAAKKRLDDNGRFSRWLSRRRQTCQNLVSAVPAYMEIHGGLDPTALLVPDLMSDEASGPEEGGETVLEWKRRMAALEGRVDVSDEFLAKKAYFEVITPNWRSDALTEIYRELWQLWYNALSVRFANAMVTRIRTSERATNTPPPYSPYNFGINQEWYTQYKSEPTYKILLRTWGQFPDPPGFGTNAEAEGAPPEPTNTALSSGSA